MNFFRYIFMATGVPDCVSVAVYTIEHLPSYTFLCSRNCSMSLRD